MNEALAGELERLAQVCRKAASAYGRPDLLPRIDQAVGLGDRDEALVLVVGEFKQGKSTLVNALVGQPVAPVDVDHVTAVPTAIRRGASAHLLVGADGATTPIAVEDLADTVRRAPTGTTLVSIDRPDLLLPEGVIVVDGPGEGGVGAPATSAMVTQAVHADLVLVVSDATGEVSAPEIRLIERLRQVSSVALVVTKTDLTRHAERIIAADRRLLGDADAPPIHACAAVLGDADPAVPALRQVVLTATTAARDRARRRPVAMLISVIDELVEPFAAEARLLRDPDHVAALLAAITDAETAAADRRERAKAVSAGLVTQLSAVLTDVDHDLRRRMKELRRELEEHIESADARREWDAIVSLARDRSAEEIAGAAATLEAAVAACATDLGEALEAEVSTSLDDAIAPTLQQHLERDIQDKRTARGLKARFGGGFTIVRGGVGGVTMVSILAAVTGVTATAAAPLVAPVALALGGGLSAKTLFTEKDKRRKEARSAARTAVLRYLDDVTFEVAKQLRDETVAAQQALRTAVADAMAEADRTAQQRLTQAREAAGVVARGDAAVAARLADVEAEVTRLEALRGRVDALASPSSDSDGTGVGGAA